MTILNFFLWLFLTAEEKNVYSILQQYIYIDSIYLWDPLNVNVGVVATVHDANLTTILTVLIVRYHSGGSMKLNACILLLAHKVYL